MGIMPQARVIQTYWIGKDRDGFEHIRCLMCGLCSYLPMDVEQRYCGRCHIFHTENAPPVEPAPAA